MSKRPKQMDPEKISKFADMFEKMFTFFPDQSLPARRPGRGRERRHCPWRPCPARPARTQRDTQAPREERPIGKWSQWATESAPRTTHQRTMISSSAVPSNTCWRKAKFGDGGPWRQPGTVPAEGTQTPLFPGETAPVRGARAWMGNRPTL